MKSILRSPIEPEFIYFLKTAFRKRKAALERRIQSDLARFSASLIARKKDLKAVLDKALQKIQRWQEESRAKYLTPSLKKSASLSSAFQTRGTRLSHAAVSSTSAVKDLGRKIGSIGRRPSFDRWPVLGVIFMVALLAGMGLKTIARDSITIGFEDYKLARNGNIIDLNAVQKRVLSGEAADLGEQALTGEQCTE